MPDESKSLDILIKTKAEGAGAQQAQKALQGVKDAANELKGANQQLQQAEQEGGKETERFGLKKQELKKIVRELGHEFPLAGMAARAWLNPVGVAATVAIGLFVKVKEKIAEMNKEMDEMAERAAKPIGDMAGALRESVAAAGTAAVEFGIHLKELATQEESLLEKTNAVVGSIKKQETAFLELTDAREALATEMINTEEKLGKISSMQAIVQRAAVKEAFDKQRRQVKADAEAAELGTKEGALKQAQSQTGPLLDTANAARAAATDPRRVAGMNDLKARIPQLEENVKAYNDKFLKASDARETVERQLEAYKNYRVKDVGKIERLEKEYEEKKGEEDRLRQIRDANQRELDRTRKVLPERQRGQERLDAASTEAQNKLNENTAAIRSLELELKQLREDSARNRQLRESVGALHTQQRATQIGGDVAKADQAEEKKTHTAEREEMRKRAGAVSQKLKDTLEGSVGNTDNILLFLERFMPGIKAQVDQAESRLQSLERQAEKFDKRITSSLNP